MNEMKEYNRDYLEELISDGIEESLNMDYKAADALGKSDGKKSEIAKDISAMANSAGGIIIYGIKEYNEEDKKHLPEKITPINRKDFSKEWLEHIINSNISPKIEKVIIHPVSIDLPNEVVYIVKIPQSITAHQNIKDKRYYKRFNFESVPMPDYEIRDVMNRVKNPIIELEFEITEQNIDDSINLMTNPFNYTKARKLLKLIVSPSNVGFIYAKYVNYYIFIPEDLLNDNHLKAINGFVEHYGENVYRDVLGFTPGIGNYGGVPKYGSSRFDPILPGRKGIFKKISFVENSVLDEREISWRVYADNASPIEGKIRLCDIKYIKIEQDKNE